MADMSAGGGGQGVVPAVIPQPGPYLHLPQDPGGPGGGVGGGGGGGYGPGPISMGSLADKLRVAASKGQVDKMQDLLLAGAGLEADRDGRTALHYAAQNGHSDGCKLLIEKGCDLDTQDSMGYTALLRACSQGLLDVVRICLEAGCNVEFADEHGNTPLHEASWHGFSKCVELLIQYNANVFRTNQSGFSALHLTSQNGHNESSRVLLYGGINPDMQNNYGDTALHTAARYGHAGVTRILISAKCKLNIQNKNGDTALHIASALKRRKIAKILVESHADHHVRNKQNETAIEVARRKEHPEIILIITSLSRPHSTGPKTREAPGVTFKDEIEVDDGPVVCADDEPPTKADTKQEKERGFLSFFKKKKKDKDKEKDKERVSQSTTTQVKRPVPPGKVQPIPSKPVSGFFSQYVPRTGTQYYRDLAGNIKQGPVGYTPVCQCGPALHHIEKTMHTTREQLYEHIDASHQVLQDRIEQLDLRTSQQAHSLDHLTRERLEAERRACQAALEQRLQRERHHTQHVVESYGDGLQGQIQGWLEDRLASYGHCLDHHHDDSALPPRHIFTDVHLMGGPDGVGGRLFRSRSDETLSVSDYSGKGRKKQFYESRKAAMEQIRGWKVPVSNKDSARRRDSKGRNAVTDGSRDPKPREDNNNNNNSGGPTPHGGRHLGSAGNIVTVAEVHSKPHDRTADGASPKYEGEGVAGMVARQQDAYGGAGGGRQTPSYGAIPRRASQPHPQAHIHAHTPAHLQPPHPHPTERQSPHRVSQSRSYGNLASPRPSSIPPVGASLSPSPTTPVPGQPSQYPAGGPQPQPRRGILRSKTDEGGLHERSRSSPRQQSNLDERGPQGEGSFGLNPGGREGPFLGQQQQQPATTGPMGNATAPTSQPRYHQYQQHNPLYGSAQFSSSPLAGDSASPNSHAVNVDADSQRYRPRTRSIDGVLDVVDGYSGGRFRSRSEERILDSGDVPTPHYPAASSHAADCSGYVTDSGMRRSYLDHHSNQHYNLYRQDRTSGYWPQANARPEFEDRDGGSSGRFDRNNAARSASDDRSGGRFVSGDVRSDTVRSVSNDRGPDSSQSYANSHRPHPNERNSGNFLESDAKRGGGGGGGAPQSVNWHSANLATFSSTQIRQQRDQQLSHQPATRYRVLPPLPPSKPVGNRTYPQVPPKPGTAPGGQGVYSRTQPNGPAAKDAQQGSNPGRYNSSAGAAYNTASGQSPDNPSGRRNDAMAFQSYNYTGSGSGLQERSMARRTDSPRELWESSRQLAKDKAGLNCSSTALSSNNGPVSAGGAGRTASPYSSVGGGNRNSVSKSEGNLAKTSDQSSMSSPRDGAPSGHYSVSNGCLRHESYSYPSPVYSGVGGGKEDSTCSSNQDSGYSSRMVGSGGPHGKTQGDGAGGAGGGRRRRGEEEDGGRGGAESTTPSSSFSTDRSLSAGLPSNTSSPYLHLGGGNSYGDYMSMGGGVHSYGEYVPMTPLGGGRDTATTSTPTPDFHQPGQRGLNPYRNYPQGHGTTTATTNPQLPDYQMVGRKGAWDRCQPTSSVPDSTYPPFQQSRAGTTAPTPTSLPASNGGWGSGNNSSNSLIQKQVQGWYQQKLLEAAQRLRNSEQYGHAASSDHSSSNNFGKGFPSTAAVPIRYDPVHGSDV